MATTETRVKITADNRTKETFKKVNRDIQRTTTSTQKLRKATAVLATAYIALRGVGKVVNIWREFGATMADLSAITGATGKDLEFLKQKSLEFGAATTLTASQAAEAFKLVASAKPDLLESGAALAAVTKEAITLAEASGSTLPDAARTLGVALNQYGAGAEEASRFINVLAAGAKRGASEIADTAEAIKVAGLVAAGTNTSFEEMNAAIQVMSTVALKGSEAGTGLRNVYLNLANQSEAKYKPAIVGFTKAMENLHDAGLNDVQMLEIFGKKNIVAAKALINNADKLGKMREQLTGTTTAYEQAAVKVDNLDGDMKKMGSTWESVALMLGETFDPALRGIIQLFVWLGKVAKTIILTFQDIGNKLGATAAQLVAIAKLDFAAVTAIGKARDANAKKLETEYNLLWKINGAQETVKKTVTDSGGADRIAAIKAKAKEEALAAATALSAANQELWAKEDSERRDKYANDLFSLEEHLMTANQSIRFAFDNRSFIIEDAFQTGLIDDARRNALLLQLTKQHEADKTRLAEDGANARRLVAQRSLGAAAGIFDGLAALMSDSGKKQTKETQNLARLSIIASTAQAVMSALAVTPYPLGVALAVGAGLKGAAQLRAVGGSGGGSITQPGSAGSGSYSGVAPPPTVAPSETAKGTTTVNIYGAITADMIRDTVIPVMKNEMDEHDLILFSQTSRQARSAS